MEIKGTIICKKADNKAFKLGDNWYNVNDPVIPFLEKIGKGDFVTVQYEKKGVSRYVSKITIGKTTEESQEEPSSEFACEVCGKALKDGKFKKCYTCNQSKATKKEEKPQEESTSEFKCEDCGATLKDGKYKKCYPCGKKAYKGGKGGAGKSTYYDNPEKTAQIQRGNALNAAGAVASSQQFADPETAKQFTLMLADEFLNWLRGE
jgi:hypothetical protein